MSVLAAMLFAAAATQGAPVLPMLTTPESDYVEYCSGCHGMQGNSAPAEIPVLRDRVGYFMCTKEGRDYLIRLPTALSVMPRILPHDIGPNSNVVSTSEPASNRTPFNATATTAPFS